MKRRRALTVATTSLTTILVLACAGTGTGTSSGTTSSSSSGTSSGASSSGEPADPKLNGMLAAHNKVRAEATPTPNPPLTPYVWSEEDAKAAQDWANGCVYNHNPNNGGRGENIFASAGAATVELVVKAWADEAANYIYDTNKCRGVCGHYTQIVWSSTTSVGCGMKACNTGSPFKGFTEWELWVCNYSPPGNYVGKKPY